MAGTIHCRSKAGIMAVWLGRFPDPEDFYRYVQICYRSENEEEWDPAYIFRRQYISGGWTHCFGPKTEIGRKKRRCGAPSRRDTAFSSTTTAF